MNFLSLLISHLEWTESELMVSCQNVNKIAFHFIASLTLAEIPFIAHCMQNYSTQSDIY